MVDRRITGHVKAMLDLHARIISRRVVCIDSNFYFREFVCWFLSDVGCEVKGVATAKEGLSLIREEPAGYDILIIADWLPDMDGVELLQRPRSMPYAGRIAMTAPQLSPEQRAIYESLGASSILITPLGYSELMRVLEAGVAGGGENGHRRGHAAQALPSLT